MREYAMEDRADREQAASINEFYNRQATIMNVQSGRAAANAGIAKVLANTNPAWKAAWSIYVYNLPTGWTGLGEQIRFSLETLGWFAHENAWGGMVSGAIKKGILEQTDVWAYPTDVPSHASAKRLLRRTPLVYNNANGNNRRIDVSFDLGERIKQVRAIEKYIEDKEEELATSLAQHHRFVEMGRAEILAFLNQTNQKSSNTEWGGCHWKPKITYRVEDKDAFRRHVIGAEAWELPTWAAAPVSCEAFTEEHKMPPPGLVRNAVNILYITPPVKSKAKNKIVTP
jgi:hypothetical protein